jgi:hypothetical protein
MSDAEVDANCLSCFCSSGQGRRYLQDHRDVIAARWMPGHGHGCGRHVYTAAEAKPEPAKLGQRQTLGGRIESEGAPSIFRTVPCASFFLEDRIGASLGKEIHECRLQMPKGLLEWHTGDVIQKRQVRVLLQDRQLRTGPQVGQSFATLERGGPCGQHAVIDQAATAERLVQLFGLRLGGIRPEGPTSFHEFTTNILRTQR